MIQWLVLELQDLSFLVSGDPVLGSGVRKEDRLDHGVAHLVLGDLDHLFLQT